MIILGENHAVPMVHALMFLGLTYLLCLIYSSFWKMFRELFQRARINQGMMYALHIPLIYWLHICFLSYFITLVFSEWRIQNSLSAVFSQKRVFLLLPNVEQNLHTQDYWLDLDPSNISTSMIHVSFLLARNMHIPRWHYIIHIQSL